MQSQIKINTKLLGHILNDAFLCGSVELEGNFFSDTAAFLYDYTKTLQSIHTNNQDLEKVIQAFNQLADYSRKIDTNDQTNDAAVDGLVNDITDKVIALKNNDYVLMPGGWRGLSGHAIIYKFCKSQEGDWLFEINNAGDGLQFHERAPSEKKVLYNPVLTYKIPKDQIKKDSALSKIIEELIIAKIPRLQKKDKANAEYLYKKVLPKFAHIDGKIIDSEAKPNNNHWQYTGGQNAGTCAQRSLHIMLRSCFSNKQDYKLFMHRFKFYSIQKYVDQPKPNSNGQIAQQPIAQEQKHKTNKSLNQLEKAAQNNLRSLYKLYDAIPEDERKNTQEKLENILKQIKDHKAQNKDLQKHKTDSKAPIKQTAERSGFELNVGNIHVPDQMQSVSNADRGKVLPNEPIIAKGGDNLLQEMDDIIQRCSTLQGNNQYYALIEQIESFFINLPLPQTPFVAFELLDFYSSINSNKNALEFFKKFNILQDFFSDYQKLHSDNSNTNLPRYYVARMSAFSVAEYIDSNFFNKHRNIQYQNHVHSMFWGLSNKNLNCAHFGQNDPKIDERLQQLRNLHKSAPSPKPRDNIADENAMNFYDELINRYGNFKTQLEQLYLSKYRNPTNDHQLHNELKSKKYTALYYLFTHKKELENDNQYKLLIEALDLQQQIECAYLRQKKHNLDISYIEKEYVDFKLSPQTNLKAAFVPDNLYNPDFSYQNLQNIKYNTTNNAVAYALNNDIAYDTGRCSEYTIGGYQINFNADKQKSENSTQIIPGKFATKTNASHNTSHNAAKGLSTDDKNQINKRTILQNDLEERELFHLRSAPQKQILLTLDYFIKNIDKLLKAEMKIYLEANLFQPGLLIDQLSAENADNFFKIFKNFIAEGLNFYGSNNKYNADTVFFIRMQYLVYQYAAKLNKDKFKNHLINLEKDINSKINEADAKNIKAELHQYRFLIAIAKLQTKIEQLDQNNITQILESYFYIQANDTKEELDPDTKIQINFAKDYFERYLRREGKKLVTDPVLKQALKSIGFNALQNDQINLERFPQCAFQNQSGDKYATDIAKGLVFSKGRALASTPLDILNHPVTKQLGLNKDQKCFKFANCNTYMITSGQQCIYFEAQCLEINFFVNNRDNNTLPNYNIIKEKDGKFYKLIALSDDQKKALQLPDDALAKNGDVPSFLTEYKNLAWLSSDKQEILVDCIQSGNQFVCTLKEDNDKAQLISYCGKGLEVINLLYTHNNYLIDYLSQYQTQLQQYQYQLQEKQNALNENYKQIMDKFNELQTTFSNLTYGDKATLGNNHQLIMVWQNLLINNNQYQYLDTNSLNQYREDFVKLKHNTTNKKQWVVRDDQNAQLNTAKLTYKNTEVFEDKKFVIAKKDTQGKTKICLHRYGLEFSVDSDNDQKLGFNLENKDYEIDENTKVFRQSVANMVFKAKGGADDKIVILPVQRFIAEKNAKGDSKSEYYQFKHDINNKVNQSIIDKQKVQPNQQNQKAGQIWQYTNTEHHFILKIKDGKPVPQKPEEALYLCYLYLGSNQPKKAWQVLEYCNKELGGITGAYNEAKYISWIVDALPQKIKDNDKSEDEKIVFNPDFVACKLKALALFTDYLNQGKSITWPDVSFDASTYNHNCQKKEIEDTTLFCQELTEEQKQEGAQGLSDKITALYRAMQKMQSKVRYNFALTDDERKSVLNYRHNTLQQQNNEKIKQLKSILNTLESKEDKTADDKNLINDIIKQIKDLQKAKAIDSVGYDWVKYNLKSLKSELANLNAKENKTEYETKQAEEIQSLINKHEGIFKTKSRVKDCKINLSLPHGISINKAYIKNDDFHHELNHFTFACRFRNQPEAAIQKAEQLKYKDDREFAKEFHKYLYLAVRNHEYPDLTNRLKEFCKKTLIASSATKLNEQNTNVPLLCNVLYRILCSKNLGNTKQKIERNMLKQNQEQYTLFDNRIDFINQLINITKNLDPDAIYSPQIVNDTDEKLTTTNKVFDAIPNKKERQSFAVKQSQKDKITNLTKKFSQQIQLVQNNQSQWDELDADFTQAKNGKDKDEALLKLQNFAKEKLAVDNTITNLSNAIQNLKQELEQNQKEENLLKFANQGPEDKNENAKWKIEVASKQRKKLNINDLLTLYFHADKNKYKEETGLSDQNIKELNQNLAEYISNRLLLQQLNRTLSNIKELESASEDEKDQARFCLAKTIFAKNIVDVYQDPALAVFQYHENILLRPKQKEVISRLLESRDRDSGYKESIEKVIMGGGKSKVILPALAQEKATGQNLVIIEVPAALLDVNYRDLKKTSNKLFNQDCRAFAFSRYEDCCAKKLQDRYYSLVDAINNKEYIVTGGNTLQSLELKYLELLSLKPEIDAASSELQKIEQREWEEQIDWSDKLVSLFKNRGDLIIDEVHQGLLLKNKLNYSVGEGAKIDKEIAKNTVLLYQFFKHVNLISDNVTDKTLQDLLKNNKILTTNAQFKAECKNLADKLIDSDLSPIKNFIDQNCKSDEFKKELKKYLNNESDDVPIFVKDATSAEKNMLALCKEQINNLLAYNLQRNCMENYGPSQLSDIDPFAKVLAIPYITNNTPKEGSRFGNYLETINYSIQSLLISGLSKDLVRGYLKKLKSQDKKEKLDRLSDENNNNQGKTIAEQLFEQFIQDKSNGIASLADVDLQDDTQLTTLHKAIKNNEDLIYELLKKDILPNITVNAGVLRSDAYNHVELVRSCQGVTGTPWNHTTFHQRLKYDAHDGTAEDDYIAAAIKRKAPSIKTLDFNGVDDFVEKMLEGTKASTAGQGKIKAIIDVSATFKGVDNFDVAKAIAKKVKNQGIEYVLFFNKKNELSAVSTKNTEEVKVIGSSDPSVILEHLGCEREKIFTFYDQSHTTGTDIKQISDAKGLVLIDHKTSISNFLQAAMRMRGLLEGNQSIDLVTTSTLQGKNFDSLLDLMKANESEQLQKDNFDAAMAKMTNIVRADLMGRILDEKIIDQKHNLFQKFKKYLIEKQNFKFFDQYGGIDHFKDTKDVLDTHKNQLITDWKQLTGGEQSAQSMESSMDDIITKACTEGVCATKQLSKNTSTIGTEVQVQQEVQQEVYTEKEVQAETFNAEHIEEKYVSPNYFSFDMDAGIQDKTLKEIFNLPEGSYIPDFHQNIFASCNYYKTYQGQTQFVSQFLKPVHALQFFYDPQKQEGEQLSCRILSQEELRNNVHRHFAKTASSHWISTTQHIVIDNKIPEEVKALPEYQSIIEQVRFFAGDLSLFAKKNASANWLGQDPEKKFKFFEKHLYSCRETTSQDLDTARKLFSNRIKTYKKIAEDPEEFLDKFKGQANNDYDQNKEEYDALAAECKRIKNNWWCGYGNLQDQNLSLNAKAFLQNYASTINDKKEFIKGLDGKSAADLSQIEIDKIRNAKAEACKLGINNEIERIIDKATASNKDISCEELQNLKEKANTDQNILCGLMHNQSNQITEDVFQELQNYTQNTETLILQAGHRHLKTTEQFLAVRNYDLNQIDGNNQDIKKRILSTLIQNQNITKPILIEVIKDQDLSEQNIKSILDKNFIDNTLIKQLVEKCESNQEKLKVIINHTSFKKAEADTLTLVIDKLEKGSEVFEKIKIHKNVDDTIKKAIEHKNSSWSLQFFTSKNTVKKQGSTGSPSDDSGIESGGDNGSCTPKSPQSPTSQHGVFFSSANPGNTHTANSPKIQQSKYKEPRTTKQKSSGRIGNAFFGAFSTIFALSAVGLGVAAKFYPKKRDEFILGTIAAGVMFVVFAICLFLHNISRPSTQIQSEGLLADNQSVKKF